jgi:hypothetical protein
LHFSPSKREVYKMLSDSAHHGHATVALEVSQNLAKLLLGERDTLFVNQAVENGFFHKQ